MKRLFTNLKAVGMVMLLLMVLVSCYQFGRVAAAKQVAAKESFDGRIVVVNDNTNGPVTGYGVFAVRVPTNWNVEVNEGSYVSYAKEGVIIPADENDPEGKPAESANVTDGMKYSSLLSDFYNTTNPKEGYTWFAFVTINPHRRGLQGSASNSCDSIAFNYVVTNDGIAGEYELDYIIGDAEEEIENFVGRLDDAGGTRLFRASTEQASIKRSNDEDFFEKVQPEFKTKVTVLEGEGEPTVHNPSISPTATEFAAGEAVSVEYSDMAPDTRIVSYKYANLVPQAGAYTIEGLQRFNNGTFTIEGLEPGQYHLRAINQEGNPIEGIEDVVVNVAYPEFEAGANSLMVVSDLSLMAPEILEEEGAAFEKYRMGDAKLYKESPQIVQTLIDKALEVKPTALLITGDLTKDGEKVSHELLASKLQALKDAGIKVFVVPGDKDVNNPNAQIYNGEITRYTENISAEEFATIYGDFGYNDAVSRDETSLSYIAYPTDELAILAIDACRYGENERVSEEPSDEDVLVAEGRVTTETIEWMTKAVEDAKATGRKIVVMMHHLISAPFNGYATLGSVVNGQPANIAAMFGGGDGEEEEEPYEVTTADVQNALAELGLGIVFTGDVKATDIQRVITSEDKEIYQIATAGLTAYDCPFRLVNIEDETADIQTRVIKEVESVETEGMTFEDYAYDRTKNKTPDLVSKVCDENWELIDGIMKDYFVFDYDPEVDLFDKNMFMSLPVDAADMANRVNTTILPPLLDVITSFVEGNEDKKDSQALVDGVKNGFDGFFDTLNTLPSIITPMIKEGFADAGLDTDALTEQVVGSLAYNYLGEEDNVCNDLFITLPIEGSETAIKAIENGKLADFNVKVAGREVIVEFKGNNASNLTVFTADGALTRNVSVVRGDGNQRLLMPKAGIYFVRLGNKVKKIVVQ